MSDQAAVGKDVFAYTIENMRREFENAAAEQDLRQQQRFDAQEKAVKDALEAAKEAVTAALSAADRAVLKAEAATEKRFDAVNERFGTVNEFRGQLADQASTFMPRTEFAAENRNVREKIDDLAGIIATIANRQEHFSGERLGVKEDRSGLYAMAGFILVLLTIGSMVFAFFK